MLRQIAERSRQREDGGFRGRRLLAALHLAQVGRLHGNGGGDAAERELGVISFLELEPSLSDIVAEGWHVCIMYDTVNDVKAPSENVCPSLWPHVSSVWD